MPTEQPVPETTKSPAPKSVKFSVLVREKLRIDELFGEVGADSATVGAPRSITRVCETKLEPGPDLD